MLSGNLLATPHDLRDTFVVDENFMLNSAFAAEVQDRTTISNKTDMTIAQRGKAKTLVVASIFRIADAYARGVEDADDDCKHLFAWETRKPQVALEFSSQLRQRLAKRYHTVELRRIAHLAPLGVIAILLAAACISASCLQMAAHLCGNPNVPIRRRNCETR